MNLKELNENFEELRKEYLLAMHHLDKFKDGLDNYLYEGDMDYASLHALEDLSGEIEEVFYQIKKMHEERVK